MLLKKGRTTYRCGIAGRSFVYIFITGLFLFLGGFPLAAQFTDPASQTDTTRFEGLRYPIKADNYPFSNSGNQSPLYLRPPSNVKQNIVYDPVSKKYIFTERVGDFDIRPGSSMSLDEYRKYEAKKSQSAYWREKAIEDIGEGPSFMKSLRLGNQSVDKVFGTDIINITPQGSAELIFGYTVTEQKNPLIPIKNQRNGSFLFKEKIMMNVTGSIGDKMEVELSYNTEASFNFENKTKLEYAGKEDEIIKKIEAGDVSLNLPGSLITGSQSLFGIKTELQFGRLNVTSVMSHQEGESSTITVQGGAQLSEFEIDVDDYDANRHFFLSHFFRDHYNEWLQNLPYIESQLQIQQIEVWVVNKQNNYDNSRDIVAFMDLGEGNDANGQPHYYADFSVIGPVSGNDKPVSNNANGLYSRFLSYGGIRDLGLVEAAISAMSKGAFDAGRDYVKVELARPLSEREYTLNSELGYISLNSPLRNDEILAVAFTYTYRGKTYKVGELSNDPSTGALIVKLLKGETQSPKFPNWDLMMKNVYSIGAFQVSQEKFVLDVLYRNDRTGVPVNYIGDSTLSDDVQNQPLLKVLELDNLDSRNEPNPDGLFDFVEGVTINSRNGRIYFPVLEPFGEDLKKKLEGENPDFEIRKMAEKYVFRELYDSTKTRAEQVAEKNKFFLKGVYRSSSSSEIQLNAMNVPRGSVTVTAGGRKLTENQDFTVDYTLGRVKIINTGLLESGTPIKISLESTATFNLQTKTLLGTHLDYRFSENFNIGATVMNLTERPITEKVNMGDEPISNTIWGLNTSYRTKSQFLTTLVDKLPFLETKETSSIMMEGEFAHLIPGQSKAIGENGIAYIDDFEAAQTKIEMKYFSSWFLSSAPKGNSDFMGGDDEGLASGYGRAKLAWYVIDPLFYKNTGFNPGNPGIFADLESHYARRIREKEIFPQRESDIPGQNFLTILNLAYYPEERGPYNYDPFLTGDAKLPNPEDRWGGIMRPISQSDFETSNIEFVEFWVMDPFLENPEHTGGDMYIHLGEISEDILRDSRKSFESGLPDDPSDLSDIVVTEWGHIPSQKTFLNTFAGDEGRPNQDVGLDGLNDENEASFFNDYLESLDETAASIVSADPSGDNFMYYLNPEHDLNDAGIFERYKNYNNLEGNSPSQSGSTQDYTESNSNMPDIEDVNNDNTLNTVETYFQYRVSLRREDINEVGKNYIVDKITVNVDEFDIPVVWYQFKIPLDDWEKKVGDIEDFKSVRFMRVMLSGFEQNVFLRFATLDLVRSDWRRYNFDIGETTPFVADQTDAGNFEVSAVNIEENSQKQPVNYILPKGISRVTDPNNQQVAHLNEQSLLMKVKDLEDADARAVFKNIQLDLRQYKNLEMFIHAEALPGLEADLEDYELSAFIRLGSDYKNNYYEIEVPLELTPAGEYNGEVNNDRLAVWPDNNRIEFIMEELVELKKERNRLVREDPLNYSTQSVYSKPIEVIEGGKVVKYNTIKVKGNPNFSNIRQIMLGVRNPGDANSYGLNDGLPKSAEIWFNELRLTDFNNKGGWASNGRIQAQLADFGVVSIAGSKSTAGFGSIEEKVEERSMEDINEFDISSNLELGKFFPEKAKVSIPLYIATSRTIINPEYYPKDPDIKFKDVLEEAATRDERDSLKILSQDHTSRASVNISNMRWNKKFEKVSFLSPSNLSATIGYTETLERNYSTEYNNLWKYNVGLNYVFNTRPTNIQPFRKSKGLRKPIFKLIRDFNFNPYPSRFTFGTVIDRNYQEIKLRNVYDDVELLIEPTVNKDFNWDRKYDMNWDLTRSLKLDYSATNIARIDEPQGQQDLFKSENDLWKEEVWRNIREGGRNMNFNQKIDLSYNVPINKIPFLNWTSLNTSYGTNYSWIRGDILPDPTRELGNTIKNSNTIKITSNLNLRSLYGNFPYLKKLEKKSRPGTAKKADEIRYREVSFEKRTFLKKDSPRSITHKLRTENVTVKVTDAEGKEIDVNLRIVNENRIEITADEDLNGLTVRVDGKIPRGENPLVFIGDNTVRLLTGFKSINFAWTRTSGSVLSGYLPETNLFGFNLQDEYYGAPGYPFVFGIQDSGLVRKAIDQDLLTKEPTFSRPYEFNRRDEISYRATYEPFKGLRIDFTGTRSYSEFNEQIFFFDDTLGNYQDYFVDHAYRSGNFSISMVTIATAFESPREENGYYSEAFEQLRQNRSVISRRLYEERVADQGNYIPNISHGNSEALYDGYGATSQEVLIPAFLSAYTGTDPNKVTLESFFWTILPNWRLSFDGLSDLDFIQKYMKTLSISHTYKSTYSINGFGTNVGYFDPFDPGYFDADEGIYGLMRDSELDYISRYQYNSVSIKEELRPLIGLDMTWHNSLLTKLEFSRSRTISMSLNNNQINETRNNDYTLGAGYRFKEVPINIRTGGQKKQVKSDLNVRLDISLRDNLTVLRFLTDDPLEEDDHRVTTGGREVKTRFTADYVFSDSFSIQLFFNRDVVNPYTTTTYPTKETSFGFNLRLTL